MEAKIPMFRSCTLKIPAHAPYLEILESLAKFVIPLSALPPYATPWAIYFHFWHGELAYIGRAEDARARTSAHRSQKDFEEVYCLLLKPDNQRHFDLIERALIRYFDPPGNRFAFTVDSDDLEVMDEVLTGYGLKPGKIQESIAREDAPPFTLDQAERLWLKTNSRAHRALLLIANASEPVSEYDEEWPNYCSMTKTVAYIDNVSHRECRAKSPIAVGGSCKDRYFSMAPDMAAAFIECAARAEAA